MDLSINVMDTDNASSTRVKSPAGDQTDVTDVVEGHAACQTKTAKWLHIGNIYEKLHRPNIYDIGGTYIDDVPDFWFTCKTESLLGTYLLHIFAGNHSEGTHTLGVSSPDSLVFNAKDQNVYVKGNIEVIDLECKPHNQSYVTTIHFKNADVEDILKNRKLYIAVQLSVMVEEVDETLKNIEETIQLFHDNEHLLLDPVGSDFIIESSDGKEFAVHRTILSHRSDVFKAMLHEDMAESRTGRVKLVDVSNEDLKNMLEYIYTSTIKSVENINMSNIIMLADRYNISGLRQLCDNILIDQLEPDTALDILVIADQFDCTDVKSTALQFIKRNKECFKNAKFDNIYSIGLMKDLCAAVFS